ncbi:MAG: hypothetical protein J4N31_02790 [Chloroflexi bacterium]|nr:hypothetical protein [Chloroflexota bacterium]MCI0778720.1 hypothetical protein [Chloroflexota bacterium]MCI0821244.1 hypothetical protein [Chloroflexota bacterium]MCI0888234.1 hypothetical protein [Chloroflexota bacterium]
MKWLTAALLLPLAALLIYVSADLPDRGDPDAPANLHLSPELVEVTERDIEIPNIVTAVLADVRGYDTLGETLVVFTAGLAVLLVLMRGARPRDSGRSNER